MKPLTLGVCITITFALIVGTCGCTSSPNSSTANPTAASSTHNAFLEQFAEQYKNDRLKGDQGGVTKHTIDIAWPSGNPQTVNLNEGWVDQNGVECGHHIIVTNCGSVQNATDNFTLMTAGQDLKDDGHGFLWGADTYNEVTGHKPTVEYMLSNESYVYLQYDQYYLGLTVMCPTPAMQQQPGKIPAAMSTTPTPSGHNQALKKLVDAYEQAENIYVPGTLIAFNVKWLNDDSVTLEAIHSGNHTWSDNYTWIAFPTTQDATNYLNALNKSNYILSPDSNNDAWASQYYNATGHYTQTYQSWGYIGPTHTGGLKYYNIEQRDSILVVSTITQPSIAG